jgi:probable F420-dependent oxidoreductase
VLDLPAMAHPRRFRFAVELHEPFADRTWGDTVREVEALGYSTMFVPDHFDEGLGPLAAMAAAAAVTTTMNVGSLVLDCDFRHPAVLARELATIDALSEGRLEVGLGAGWKNLDYQRSGIVMERPGVRVDRMIEHTTVLKGLFAPGPFTFAGEHYQIADLDGTPAPFHPTGPPFLIGGGAKRVLRFAGATADIIGLNASVLSGEVDGAAARDAAADRIDQKLAWVREGAGDRFDEIEFNAWLAVVELTDAPDTVGALVAELFGIAPEELPASPLNLIGTIAGMAELLQQRRERWGYSYHVLPGAKARDLAPLVSMLSGT